MAGRFSFSVPERRHAGDPWFRVGQVDVTTTVFVVGLTALSMVAYAIDKAALSDLALVPAFVRDGDLWRIVTWPLFNRPEIWTVITLAIFWYFGRELEANVGRTRFLVYLGYLTLVPGLAATALNTDDLNFFGLYGFDLVQLGVFVAFVAEFPFVRFFFGVPGWVIGAVVVAIQFLQFLADDRGGMIVVLFVLLAVAGFGARAMGLAASVPWIPVLPIPGLAQRRKAPKRKKPPRSGRGGGDVVAGPWSSTTRSGPTRPSPLPQPPASPGAAADQAELDDLLDKISAQGMDALTSSEKQRLNELSKRMRGPR